MRFDTVIRNGTVVTATDSSLADVGIAGGKVTAIAAQLPTENATPVLDASSCLVIPAGIDVNTHLDMPFGGTTSADDSRLAPSPLLSAAPPHSSISPSSTKAKPSARPLTPG